MGNFFSISRSSYFGLTENRSHFVCSNHYYFDKNVRLDTFAVENSPPLRLFPQSRGLNVPLYASRGKSPHIRGIRDSFRQTPRILLMGAGDGDHSGTAESRSM